jgi:hypothetical protein
MKESFEIFPMEEDRGASQEGRESQGLFGGKLNIRERASQLRSSLAEKLSGSEKEKEPAGIEIIDENDSGNLLSDKSRNFNLTFGHDVSPYSREGFAGNKEKQGELARYFIQRLELKGRGPLIDVGFGSNIYISKAFADSSIKAYAIDQQQEGRVAGETIWQAPKEISANDKRVKIFSGDIAEIASPESELKGERFGLVLFNGSWASGGNNFTVGGEAMEAKYYNKQDKTESLVEFIDKEKDGILGACKKRLARDGMIGIVSSRYAFHGSGFNYYELPEEKLNFIDLYDRLRRLGAKKFHIFGVSQAGFDQMLKRSIAQNQQEYGQNINQDKVAAIRDQLKDSSSLPPEDIYSKFGGNPEYQKSRIRGVKEAAKDISGINELARIDAIFAEF